MQELIFETFDGTQDKIQGDQFSLTPTVWNKVTSAGIKRVVNFKVTSKTNETEIVLLSIYLNGGDEIRCILWEINLMLDIYRQSRVKTPDIKTSK